MFTFLQNHDLLPTILQFGAISPVWLIDIIVLSAVGTLM